MTRTELQQKAALLREQSFKCKHSNAAAILQSIANWLDGIQTTAGNLEPHEFTDLWSVRRSSEPQDVREILLSDQFLNELARRFMELPLDPPVWRAAGSQEGSINGEA